MQVEAEKLYFDPMCENFIDGLRKELTECEKAKTNKYDVFSREMSRIVDRINSERRWKKKPRGPLGACITVKVSLRRFLIHRILGIAKPGPHLYDKILT